MSTKFKAFLKDTSIRAIKTMAQTALSLFTIGQAVIRCFMDFSNFNFIGVRSLFCINIYC